MHPFHVSVCDVEYKVQSHSVELSQRIFMDDLERALNKKYNINLMLDDESKKIYRDSLIQKYLLEHIKLAVGGREVTGTYIGNEIEEDGMWCYIEYDNVGEIHSLEITSTVLLNTYEDQANIIHFKAQDYERSIKLDRKNKTGYFKVEN